MHVLRKQSAKQQDMARIEDYSSSIFTLPEPRPGYILAGRSLRLTEEYESLLRRMTFFGWFATMLLLALGTVLLNRAQRGLDAQSTA
jgi:hypothetical protein